MYRICLLLLILTMSCKKNHIASEEIIKTCKDIAGKPVFIRIFKEESILEIWIQNPGSEKFELYKVYPVCDWSGGPGPKLKEGDGQSPEGFYSVAKSQLKPDSQYHRAFNIGFPNDYDKANNRTGSFIMIHGDCVSIGCYAMTDPLIEEIYYIAEQALQNGQLAFQVHIFPFKMTPENMEKHRKNKWYSFWMNLREGSEIFEETHVPPNISVVDKKYSYSKD